MLIYVEEDIFQSPAKVIVNTVNTVGVMGKGIAKRFKDVYPSMYKEYRSHCEKGLLDVGKLWLYKSDNKWILNFPTKKHWRNPSKIEFIEAGLQKFVETYQERGITSISFPQLGCGNGGLNWENEVQPLMEQYLKPLPINVFIHIYSDRNKVIEHMNVEDTINWLHKSPSTLSVKVIWEDLLEEVEKNGKLNVEGKIWTCTIEKNYDEFFSNELEFIAMENDGYSIRVTYENLFDMWVRLRDFGFLLSYEVPIEFARDNDYLAIFQLLKLLPFIKTVPLFGLTGSEVLGVTINKQNLPDTDYTEVQIFG